MKLKAVVLEEAHLGRIKRGYGSQKDRGLKFPELTRNLSPMDRETFFKVIEERLRGKK